MAKKQKARRRYNFSRRVVSRAKKMTIPLAVVGGLMPGVTSVISSAQQSGMAAAGRNAGIWYTGYDYVTGKFSVKNMQTGLLPLAIGVGVHKLAGMIGINRAIAGAGIPFIRI